MLKDPNKFTQESWQFITATIKNIHLVIIILHKNDKDNDDDEKNLWQLRSKLWNVSHCTYMYRLLNIFLRKLLNVWKWCNRCKGCWVSHLNFKFTIPLEIDSFRKKKLLQELMKKEFVFRTPSNIIHKLK